ncbi:hypothetical protein [Rhizobium lusitanum]|uniref:portal protein n=1 Tax=Rhizobium lusitanum TaxID=293958 RepID=UPI00195E8CD9|nr:hypothetical protein [Rhizobium lusitanum]MBM7047565.1 hypothetical protein [Rhizobium lusitanum]
MARKKKDELPAANMPMGLLAPSAMRQPEPDVPSLLGDVDVDLSTDGPVDGVTIDPATGAAIIEMDDGGVTIDFSPETPGKDKAGAKEHDANLAEYIDDSELSHIAEDLLLGIQQDDQSRTDWLETRAQGIRLLGLKMENPKSGVDSSVALEGMSTVRHPLLLEAVLRFQANARGELLPSSGPVKVEDKIDENGIQDELAEALEGDLNYYLTTTATEYYPDTDRLLFYVGFGGCGFKKVYNCPIRRRPVSESVDAKDLIVSDASTDLRNSRRVTHQITMKPSTLKRMQLAGAYRDISLGVANPSLPNAVDQEIANTQGIDPQIAMQEVDRDHTIYECYCELDIKGFEDKDNKGPTGLALPYRVVIDRDSRQVLEVRRNWREDDETKLAKIIFVKYSFVPGLGFYDIGLVHILGNTTNALTAAWREMLDAGMFANFPGFIYAKLAGRQNTNEFRVPPGGGVGLETNGMSLKDAIMPLPYGDIKPAFAQFIQNVAETGQRVGGTAELSIGEGKQDAPVGTTLALLEQATKIESAVHKRLHAAQAEEFQLLKECFRENPESFVRSVKGSLDWNADKFVAALEDASIVPMADPNTPSHMHRLMKAQALVQLDKAYEGKLNSDEVLNRVITMLGYDDAQALMAPPQPPQPNPLAMAKMAELSLKSKDQQIKAQGQQQELALKAKIADQDAAKDQAEIQAKQELVQQQAAASSQELQAKQKIAGLNFLGDLAKHESALNEVQDASKSMGVLGPQ